MTRTIDWADAVSLPPEELDRLLEEDRDEIDDGAEPTDEELAAMRPGTRRPGKSSPRRIEAR